MHIYYYKNWENFDKMINADIKSAINGNPKLKDFNQLIGDLRIGYVFKVQVEENRYVSFSSLLRVFL